MGASCPETRGEGVRSRAPLRQALAAPPLRASRTRCTPAAKRRRAPRSAPLESSPWTEGAALALTLPRHVYAWTGRHGGWRRGGWRAVGPPGAPASGPAAAHPSRRRSGHPANGWLWHGASQAVAPMRAASCEAAPRLGITISPATQSEGKTSPSSASVISIEGVGLAGWEWHYVPDRRRLRVQH